MDDASSREIRLPDEVFEKGDQPMSGSKKVLTFFIFSTALALTCGSPLNGQSVRIMWRAAGIPCKAGECPHSQGDNKSSETSTGENSLPSQRELEETHVKAEFPADQAKASSQAPESARPGAETGLDAEHSAVQEDEKPVAQKDDESAVPQDEELDGEPATETAKYQPDLEQKSATSFVQLSAKPSRSTVLCSWAEDKMTAWTKIFQSSEMLFAFTGFYLDWVGPKITFATGEFILLLSVVLLWFDQNWWAMLLCGSTTQLLLNPTMCLGNLFRDRRNFVMAVLSGSADVSQSLFPIANFVRDKIPSFTYSHFLIFWAMCAISAGILGAIFLPSKPYSDSEETPVLSNKSNKSFASESVPLIPSKRRSCSDASTPAGIEHHAEIVAQASHNPMWKLSVTGQICTLPFLLFTLCWMQLAIRLNSYLDSNEAILRTYGDDGSMGVIFGHCMPLSFIPCVLVGLITEKVGVVHGTSVINGVACLVNLLSLIPSLKLQWMTLLCFIFYKSALFSIMFSFVAEIFGFANFGVLTALISFCGGVFNEVVGNLMLKMAHHFDENWFWPNVVFLTLGVLGEVCVLIMVVWPPVPAQLEKEVEVCFSRKRLTQVYGMPGVSRCSQSSFILEGERDFVRLGWLSTDVEAPEKPLLSRT